MQTITVSISKTSLQKLKDKKTEIGENLSVCARLAIRRFINRPKRLIIDFRPNSNTIKFVFKIDDNSLKSLQGHLMAKDIYLSQLVEHIIKNYL